MGRRRLPPSQPPSILHTPRALLEAEVRRRAALAGHPLNGARMPLRKFYEAAWGIVDPVRFLPNWHIDMIAEILEAVSDHQLDKVIINVPPGSAKSLMTSVLWPAWHWGPNGHPETRWLCTAHSYDGVAERDAIKNRALIESDWYQREWGTVFRLTDDQNTKDFFKNDKHGYRVSAGITSVAGQRADIVLIDDPINPAESKSATMVALQQCIDAWNLSIRTRALDVGSAIVLIMQRVHMEDLSGYFLREGGWTLVKLPGHFEKDERCRVFLGEHVIEDPRTIEGEYLHPARVKAMEEADNIRLTDAWVYAGQIQQRPVPVEGGIIKETWIQQYGEGEKFQLSEIIDQVLITVDCAFKDQEDNSWVVMQCWARRDADAYLIDQRRGHFDLPETMRQLVEFCAEYPEAAAKYVESKANGVGVVQMLKFAVPGLLGSDDDDGVIKGTKATPGQPLRKPSNLALKKFCAMSKEAKLSAVAPYFQARNIYIPSDKALDWQGKEWVKEFRYELTNFPKVRFNDQVDCTSMGVWKLLGSFVAHIKPSDVLSDLGVAINVGTMERAYGEERDTISPSSMADLAFGPSGNFGRLGRDAFGG